MYKELLLCLATLLVAAHGETNVISPRSLDGEAAKKLQQLQIITEQAVSNAKSQLNAAKSDYTAYATSVKNEVEVRMDDERKRTDGYISDMETLVGATLVATCSSTVDFQDLRSKTTQNLNSCISGVDAKVDLQITNTTSIVEETANITVELQNQLSLCSSGNIICVSPVLRKIEQATMEVPQDVDTDVHLATELILTLTPEIDGCSSVSVTSYVATSNVYLDKINQCVNVNS